MMVSTSKIAPRLAVADAAALFALWAFLTFSVGTWRSGLGGAVAVLTGVAATALVFWRVRAAYLSGAVHLHRALGEGALAGTVLAIGLQLTYWLAWIVAGDLAFADVATSDGWLNLGKQMAYAAVAGATLAGVFWLGNSLVLRRAGL